MESRPRRLFDFTRERLPESAVYSVLSNRRRRHTLQELLRSGETITVRDLSETIAARESGQRPAPRGVRDSVYVSLNQIHLPTLDEHGLIDYDEDRKVVSPNGRARDVNPYLEVRTAGGLSWVGVYQWLGIVGLLMMVGSVADLPAISMLPPLLVGSTFLALLSIATVVRLWRSRGEIARALGR